MKRIAAAVTLVLAAWACGDETLGGPTTSAEPRESPAGAAPAETDAGTKVDDAGMRDAVADADSAARCPADMIEVASFCIDRYEAPNEKGAKPLAFKTAFEGEAWCQTRGKRLCTEAEWVRACEGAQDRPFPYGTKYVKGACNDDKTWIAPSWTALGTYPSDASTAEAERLYQADPSGSRPGCASEDGVMDLTGNVAEWVVRSFDHANDYSHVMKGCYWSGCYGGSPPSCSFVNPAHPGGFRTYEAGFRCCAAAAP